VKTLLAVMLVAGVVAGCIAGAFSMAWYVGEPFYELAVAFAVVFMFVVSVVVALVAFGTYVIGSRLAARSRVGDSWVVIIGFASAVVVGVLVVAVAALGLDWFSAENYLWPTVTALAGTLVGGALALLLRNEPSAITLPGD
jgi:hypothetical protein